MVQFDAKAVCLKASLFREADQLLTLYTPEYGLLRCIAKGVKNPKSKLKAVTHPLTVNQVQLRRGRGDLHTVSHAERMQSFYRVHQDIERFAVATVAMEVMCHLGQADDPDSGERFVMLEQLLSQLDDLEVSWVPTSLSFHVGMLQLAGVMPVLDQCIGCMQALSFEGRVFYHFSAQVGGVVCPQCQVLFLQDKLVKVSVRTLQLLLDVYDADLQEQAAKAHRFLVYYWERRLEKSFKSLGFLLEQIEGPERFGVNTVK